MCNVKRIRIMAKGRRFVYQTISFIRGVFGISYLQTLLGRRIDLILIGYLSVDRASVKIYPPLWSESRRAAGRASTLADVCARVRCERFFGRRMNVAIE